MAATPEGKVKARIKQILKERHAYIYMPVTNGMGAPALDFIVCYKGYFLSIEAKAPGKHPTPRQVQTMNHIKNADGHAMVVDGTAESYKELIDWLNMYDC